MATTTTDAPFKAELSANDERKFQKIEPKSYVEAVQEGPPSIATKTTNDSSDSNSVNGINGLSGASQNYPTNGSAMGPKQGVSVMRIINTNGNVNDTPYSKDSDEREDNGKESAANGDSKSEHLGGKETIDQLGRPSIERKESKHEYSANVCVSDYLMICMVLFVNTLNRVSMNLLKPHQDPSIREFHPRI